MREKKTRIAFEQRHEDVAEARSVWAAEQFSIDPDQVVFVDETWTKSNMTRSYGRSPRGARLFPYGHWETTTFLRALRSTEFIAPLCVEGAINGRVFLVLVQLQLAPSLRAGDVVVMDKLSSHKTPGMKTAIEVSGAQVRYLHPIRPISIRSN